MSGWRDAHSFSKIYQPQVPTLLLCQIFCPLHLLNIYIEIFYGYMAISFQDNQFIISIFRHFSFTCGMVLGVIPTVLFLLVNICHISSYFFLVLLDKNLADIMAGPVLLHKCLYQVNFPCQISLQLVTFFHSVQVSGVVCQF